ncbi:MAG: polysaccharide export protein EpsE [Rhizobacter sp.]|nr:polysaccharide export protein EpsE [Rhizobacter sp.]
MPQPQPTTPARTAAAPAPAPAEPASDAPDRSRDYVVGAGDVLRISVYQSPDLSLDARVAESGVISYPLLGQVEVGGKTVGQVESTIATGLKKGNFIKQPQVSVLVVEVRGNQASVLGLANRPGRYPIEVNGMRLSQLLALAGGVAPGGSEVVTLSGIREGRPFRQKVDVSQLFSGSAQAEDPVVRNGDTLYVDRLPTIYIYGEVQRPGPISLTPDMTVMQALASGGGLTQRGTERGMKIHRRNAQGKVVEISPHMEDLLRPGDVIYVRESLF